jgi:APA family basic amino acid/polyamine antiporter
MNSASSQAVSPQHGYGLITLTALVVTGMIGSGVFTTSGFALDSLGSPQAVLAAWAVAGGIAACGATAFGALAVRMPESGGEYLYLSRAVHPFAGFVAGIISLTAGFSGSVALAALACERYVGPLLPLPEWLPPHAMAAGVVLVCGLGHATASSLAVNANTLIVLVKLTAIATLISFGYVALAGRADGDIEQTAAAVSTLSLGSFASTVMWISFSYAGFNQAVYVASEARSPQRTVPAALLTGTAITTVVYLLLNDVFLRSADAATLAGRPEVAALAAAALGGERFEWWMRLAIGVSTFSAVAGMMMAGPRVTASMASDGVFPRVFSGPHGISRAAVLQTVLALFLVYQASILELLNYVGVTLSLFSAFAVSTLWLPRTAASAEPHPRMPPLVAAAAVLYVTATLLFVVLMTRHEPRHIYGTLATIVIGVAAWPLVGRGRRAAC